MNTNIDWHYHLSGRNIKEDVNTLRDYIKNKNMKEVYVMSTYFPENGSGVSNFNVYHHIKDLKKTKMYLSLDFNSYFYMSINEIESILEIDRKKVIGIKIYTGYQEIDFESEKFKSVMNIAKKNNLYVMFHTGYLKGNKTSFNPLLLNKVISSNKKIKFIIAHLGNPFINETIQLLNSNKNLFTDISGLVDKRVEIEETKRRVKIVSENVKNKKVLFGTDFPMQDFKTTKIFSKIFKKGK